MLNFELRGNYIILTDTGKPRREYTGHAKDVVFTKDDALITNFYVEGLENWNPLTPIPFSRIDGFASITNFIDWYSENTGEQPNLMSGDIPLPVGASTSAKQDISNTLLSSIDSKLPDPTESLPVNQVTGYNTGTITTQNLVPNGVATANSAVEIDLEGTGLLSIQTTGTYTGALSVQVTNDNSRWETITASSIVNFITGAYSATITSGAIGLFLVDVGSFSKARVTGLSAMTGTAVVTLRSSALPLTGLNRSVPSGSNTIGGVTQTGTWTVNPGNTANTTPWLANPVLPAVLTTGDTGAKIANGNGNGMNNATSKGLNIVFNLSAVTGTAVFKIQGSSDGGTTWYDVPTANTATLTAGGVYGLQIYPGITDIPATTNSGTVGQINAALPRTWRVSWTIGGGGTCTITNIQVSYII